VFSSPRGVIGPKGMTGAQIAYRKNYWSPNFMKSAESTKYLKARYGESRAVLADLGLAR
jgi:tripartite-type tricarboxylate transporter receptor subunit TctC